VEAAVDFYLAEGAANAAARFLDAWEEGVRELGRHPAAGSPRYGHELDLPGLRHWRLRDFPYLVFYHERSDHVDAWRVLHGERDIPAWMDGDAWCNDT